MIIKSDIKDIDNNYIQDNHIVGINLIPGIADNVIAIAYIKDNVFYTKFIDSRASFLGIELYRDRLVMWNDNNVSMKILGTYEVNGNTIVLNKYKNNKGN